MARIPGTLISNKEAYSETSFAPVVDLSFNGQQGFITDYRTYLQNSAYVQRNVIPILLEYPRGFDYLPNPQIYISTLKSLVETQSKTIEGLNGTISVNYVENPIGASGEVQEDYSQTQRARSTPTFTWVERQGQPVRLFFDAWIFNLLGHPDTQAPTINSYDQNANLYFDFLPDFNSMSMIFIEPDPFHRRVIDAWLCVNMMPKGSGDVNGKRDIASAMQNRDISVEFTCMTMMSTGVKQFAQTLLDKLTYSGLNPQHRRSAIEGIDATITSLNKSIAHRGRDGNLTQYNEDVGYVGNVNHIANTNHYTNGNNPLSPQHNPAWVLSDGKDKGGSNGAPSPNSTRGGNVV